MGSATAAHAQEAGQSSAVGYIRFSLEEASDSLFGLPLKHRVAYSGQVTLASPLDQMSAILDIAGFEGAELEANGAYYLRVKNGPLRGEYYLIEHVGESFVVVSAEGFDLSQAEGSTVEIVKAWDLDSVFPPSAAGSEGFPLVLSTGVLPFQRGSQVLVRDSAAEGINIPAAYQFFLTADGWRQQAAGFPAAGDFVLHPDAHIVVRQPAGAGKRDLFLVGTVEAGALASIVSSRSGGRQDNNLSLARAVDLPLSELQLDIFEESPSQLPFHRKDELLVWEQSGSGINRPVEYIFFRMNGVWHQQTAGFPVADAFVLKAGSAFIIRKAASEDSADIWVHEAGE